MSLTLCRRYCIQSMLQCFTKYTTQINHLSCVPDSQLDWDYLLDPKNTETIHLNIASRKGVGDIHKVLELYKEYKQSKSSSLKEKLIREAYLIPNTTSPTSPIGESNYEVVKTVGVKKEKRISKYKSFADYCKKNGLLWYNSPLMSKLVYGPRSYFLVGDLAKMERSLVMYTINSLLSKGWQYITVPDFIDQNVINGCGFVTTGQQNQIFRVRENQGGLCLAGTAEMSIAGYFANKVVESLPTKICSYSPCFRAEEAKNKVDKDFYRLHQFTKVEMFGVVSSDQSDALLQEIVETQCELFSDLGLHYRLLDMPSEELGSPAYKKYDIEAWMSLKQHWGEISSASNCTDFQSRRLNITSTDGTFPHTVNGTGCAVPRMLIAIFEQNLTEDNRVYIPTPLQKYMGAKWITPRKEPFASWISGRPNKLLIS